MRHLRVDHLRAALRCRAGRAAALGSHRERRELKVAAQGLEWERLALRDAALDLESEHRARRVAPA